MIYKGLWFFLVVMDVPYPIALIKQSQNVYPNPIV